MPQKLTAHNFTVLDVRSALQRENIEAPGGRMILAPGTGTPYARARHFGGAIRPRSSSYARRHAVASAMWHKSKTAPRNWRTWSALFARTFPAGRRFHSSSRQSGVNTVAVADDVRSKLDDLRAQLRPACNFRWSTIFHFDRLRTFAHRTSDFRQHSRQPGRLAFPIRNWRAVLIAAVAIPASIIPLLL